jgi:hypothetical protein
LAAILAMGKPVALEARAEERETRGFISITTMPPAGRVHRELDVRAPRLHSHGADDADGRVPHGLVLLVGEGLRGSHGDGVAGVHAHGVEVLDGADDDHVVLEVAHQLQLVLLPAQDRLLDEHLSHRARLQPSGHDLLELLQVVGGAAAVPPRVKEGRTMAGKAHRLQDGLALRHRGGGAALGRVQADLRHLPLEGQPVLGEVDGFREAPIGARRSAPRTPRSARLTARLRAVCPPTVGRKGVRPLPLHDALQHLGDQGLDVRALRHRGVGHDGGGVRVDEHDLVALLAEGLAGLGAE